VHERHGVREREGVRVDVDGRQRESRAAEEVPGVLHARERREARRHPAVALHPGEDHGAPQLEERVAPDHGREHEPVRAKRVADLDERAWHVVDPVERHVGEHEVEALVWERERLLVCKHPRHLDVVDVPVPAESQHLRRAVALYEPLDPRASMSPQRPQHRPVSAAHLRGMGKFAQRVIETINEVVRGELAEERVLVAVRARRCCVPLYLLHLPSAWPGVRASPQHSLVLAPVTLRLKTCGTPSDIAPIPPDTCTAKAAGIEIRSRNGSTVSFDVGREKACASHQRREPHHSPQPGWIAAPRHEAERPGAAQHAGGRFYAKSSSRKPRRARIGVSSKGLGSQPGLTPNHLRCCGRSSSSAPPSHLLLLSSELVRPCVLPVPHARRSLGSVRCRQPWRLVARSWARPPPWVPRWHSEPCQRLRRAKKQ
jgi:hypothetical protein